MIYDAADEVNELADEHSFVSRPVAMRNAHNAPINELLLGKDLDWVL